MKVRRALAALALCALTANAAFPAANADLDKWNRANGWYNQNVPRTRHIAVITDAAMDSAGGSTSRAWRYCENQAIGRLWDALRDQGATIDFYSSNFFRCTGVAQNDTVADSLWKHIGRKHSVVIVQNMMDRFTPNDDKFAKRFFCPDSLDPADPVANIIHIGTSAAWQEGAQAADTTVLANQFGTCVSRHAVGVTMLANGTMAGTATDSSHFVFLTPRGDSIAFGSAPYAVRAVTLATGVSSVVQLFRPTDNVGAGNDRIDATVTPSGIVGPISTVYADSVAGPSEIMPIAWRVYWNSGKKVDFVLESQDNGYANTTGHVIQALVNRYMDLDKIPVSYEWDDHGTMGRDDPGTNNFSGGVAYPVWPKVSTMTPWIAQMDSMGVKWGTTGPADSLYLMATTVQGYNADKGPYTYLSTRGSRMPFVAHIHDSTTARDLSCVLGVGSQSCVLTGGAFGLPRVAFRSGTTASNEGYKSRGIYQRLIANDSAYTAKFGAGRTVPYLSFPTDAHFPVNGRTQTGASTFEQCPPDSFFLASALAGKVWWRGFVAAQTNATALTLTSLVGTTTQAKRYFTYPGERYFVDVPSDWSATGSAGSGRRNEIRCIGTTTSGLLSWTGTASTGKHYRSFAQTVLPELLHIRYQKPGTTHGNYRLGEPSQIARGEINKNDDSGWIGMFYQHPYANSFAGDFGNAEVEKEFFRVCIRDPLAALSGIAGKDYWRWVYPWELYAENGVNR